MIQVQIAATVERSGVSGLRWVLVDAGEAAQRAARAPVAAADVSGPGAGAWAVPPAGASVRRATLGVHLACAAVLLFALTSAWWVSSAMHGAPASRSASAQVTPPR
jgi:microcompartment protein CcmK/EutM